jgi:hypothetical protein
MKNDPPPRLIEVSLPLKAISAQSTREKSIRHGHISTLHIWWARRPLAALRAAIFASRIPAPDTSEEHERLEDLIATIVDWAQAKDGNSAPPIRFNPPDPCLWRGEQGTDASVPPIRLNPPNPCQRVLAPASRPRIPSQAARTAASSSGRSGTSP